MVPLDVGAFAHSARQQQHGLAVAQLPEGTGRQAALTHIAAPSQYIPVMWNTKQFVSRP
jgi:hypothetical protein